MKKIVSDIKISIDNAKSTDEIENIKQAGIERINAQKEAEKPTEPPKPTEPTKPAEPAKTCSKCGGTHADNFFGNIVCFFNRIGNWFRNLFK